MSPLSPRTGEIIVKHIALLGGGVIVGLLYSRPFMGLAAASLLATGWHLFHLNRLLRWLRDPKKTGIPGGIGPWPLVFSRIQYERDNTNKLRSRVHAQMREWREVTNALPDAGFVLNGAFQIRQHNESARRMFSLGDNDVTGLHITNIIRNPAFVEMLDAGDFERPLQIVPASDPSRIFSCHITEASPEQRLLMVRDVTERERENRIRADFVANASHELRTPLTVLMGYMNAMAEDDTLPEQWHEPVEEMSSQVSRMQALVADLLHLNQLESRLDAEYKEVPVRKLFKRIAKDASAMAGDELNIRWHLDEDVALLGDMKILRSVITNLLSNAIRFTPAGGSIDVRWVRSEQGGCIEVEDSGIGIAPEDLARVTERFYRTDLGRARHDGGSGIGLAIVKHGLSIHQGRLEIESELEHGSVFRCHFPTSRIRHHRDATLAPVAEGVR